MQCNSFTPVFTRRQMLQMSSVGFGQMALASLLNANTPAAPAGPLAPKATHFPAKAKRVIWLFMHGGPSHVDLFDPKPDLIR